ncbi:MAG TPA: alanine racemase [Acetobacteraceae bacterium]|nr:alanine racemase [Acetobacteraceae bacterium]
MTRRKFALGGAALAAGAVVLSRPYDHGTGGHDAYFNGLSAALREAGIACPTLVIDRARLNTNIAAVKGVIGPSGHATRVVAKSLPSFKLLDAVMTGVGTDRAMVFNGATLEQVGAARQDADLLLGKPLPALEVSAFVQRHATDAHPAARPQFLVDSALRLRQITDIARAHGTKIRINFEIDVGLHRGGFATDADLAEAVDLAAAETLIEPCGLMGYDPHVVKVPMRDRALAEVHRRYAACRQILHEKLQADPRTMTYNTAGSPTYHLHLDDPNANELALGSGFVKPGDFDLPTLSAHVPAAFIATPVIKAAGETRIPGLEFAAPLMNFWNRNMARTWFIYGGHWLAKPVSPRGLAYNAIFGRSSNQEMLNGSMSVRLAQDDYVFLRPDQSEAVFLQFGDLAVFDGGKITERWPTFPVSA